MCVLSRAYIDDSQDGKLKHFVNMTAVLGTARSWTKLDREWRKWLHVKPRIDYYKSREWRNLDGQFEQFRLLPMGEGRIAANAKRETLIKILGGHKKSGIGFFTSIVPLSAYARFRTLHEEAARIFPEDPYRRTFDGVMLPICRLVLRDDPEGFISFIYDKDIMREEKLREEYGSFKEKNPNCASVMRSLAQLDDELWPGLQIADLAANVATQEIRENLTGWDGITPTQRRGQILNGMFACMEVWTEPFMAEVLKANTGIDLASQARTGPEQFAPLP